MRKRILIINENVDEAEKIKERLVSAYNDVECVTSISDAVNRFVSMDFTLVILDANMSMEDDHKLLKVMRQAKRTPILLLSSQADHTERLRALQAGAHAYMGQPYSLEECLAQAEALMQLYIEAHPDKLVQVRSGVYGDQLAKIISDMPSAIDKLLDKAKILTRAKPITPGVYDVITDPTITGLIAHEAFGHGVEMDQFVKDRALAKEYVGKYVASSICNMRDGAAAVVSAGSYFFDDDGILAGDTQIIKDGILVTGISDFASAVQLGTSPTGNGRRESSKRKSYSRMTNTFFEKGTDKLEDMIASIDHGYMLFDTNNGMEDPKNWAIQCVAEYGIEIKDGKLTDNYVSPVVMSGYVPDLLKSISMISDDFVVAGSGMCGKGYKEWVRVSDGGPALKVKVKLG